MSFIIRIRTPEGVKRLSFPSKNSTYGDLQSSIQSEYGISIEAQLLSRRPESSPDFIDNVSSSTKLADVPLKHGDMLWLIMASNQREQYKQIKKEQQEKQLQEEQKQSIDSTSTNSQSQQRGNKATYKLKPLGGSKKKGGKTKMRLDELKQDPVVDSGPKHIPFHEWIQERQRKYAKTQPWNIDPPKYNYKPVQMGSHVKFAELPGNAVIVRQQYRHCDVATFYDSSPYLKFKNEWERNNAIQKCAYLIGRYEMIDNNLEKKKKVSTSTQIKKKGKLMCAKIYALYEPPQKGTGRGVKLLKDHNEDLVDSVIKACDMERIGIVFTTLPRGGKKYNGDIFMSGQEIFTSARLQEKYKNKNTGFSKFITLICHVGMKEAQCFMISDQGVAMIKNGLIAAGTTSLTDDKLDNYGFMKVNIPPPKIYIPGVVNENKEIKQGDHFAPDALLVNIIATVATKQEHVFNFVHFPSPQNATIDHIRKHLIHHKDKELHVSLSDFNLLIYLTKVIDVNLVIQIAHHVVKKERMNQELVKKIKAQLRINVPGY